MRSLPGSGCHSLHAERGVCQGGKGAGAEPRNGSQPRITRINTNDFDIFLPGVPSALSNHLLANLHVIGARNFLDSVDLLATNYILPLGGLLIALFTGWVLTTRLARAEVERGEVRFHLYPAWHFLIRYVSPFLVALVFLNKIGLF